MKSLWSLTIDQYLEIVRLSKETGLKPGDDMTPIFIEYMKEKGHKPFANTELTKDELIKEYASHGKKILDVSIDKEGKSNYKIHKKLDNKK